MTRRFDVTGFTGRKAWVAVTTLAAAAALAAPSPAQADTASCAVQMGTVNSWPSGFVAGLNVVNTGTTTLNGWRISWTFAGDQKLWSLIGTSWTQTGQNVTATNVVWNGTLAPGATRAVTANGSSTGGAFGPLLGLTCTPL